MGKSSHGRGGLISSPCSAPLLVVQKIFALNKPLSHLSQVPRFHILFFDSCTFIVNTILTFVLDINEF